MEKMENKYFTPNIEDVTLGYTFEFCSLINPHTPEWVSVTLLKNNPYRFENSKGSLEVMQSNIEKGYVRVPYLTKEQIEAEGWEECTLNDNEQALLLFSKNGYDLRIYEDYIYRFSEVMVGAGMMPCWDKVLFEGKCKDINTFRTICKLLNIK
jgi:hypothetical protein